MVNVIDGLDSQYVTAKEIADILRLSVGTIHKYAREAKIDKTKISHTFYYPVEWLERMLFEKDNFVNLTVASCVLEVSARKVAELIKNREIENVTIEFRKRGKRYRIPKSELYAYIKNQKSYNKNFIDVPKAMQITGLSQKRIYNLNREGKIPDVIKIGKKLKIPKEWAFKISIRKNTSFTLSAAASILGITPAGLHFKLKRGDIEGAYCIKGAKLNAWYIPKDSIVKLAKEYYKRDIKVING